MVLKYRVVLLWVFCLLIKVILIRCQVTLVKRNVTDSFRVSKDGCMNDIDCPDEATCQSDSGLCLCSHSRPNFLNYSTASNIIYDCLWSKSIRSGVGGSKNCEMGPFKLIPYSHNAPPEQFTDLQQPNRPLTSCTSQNVLVKFPYNVTEIEQEWLDESFINLTILDKTLYFKWKKSVPDLQGTIIRLHLRCQTSESVYVRLCLRAKVFGTWQADQNPTVAAAIMSKPATSHLTLISTMTPSLAYSNPSKEASSGEGDSNELIIIAPVVPVISLIVLIAVIWLFCRRKKINRNHSVKKTATLNTKRFKHTNSTLRGPNAYEEGKAKETAETFGAQTNPAYSTLDRNTRDDAKSQEDPGYATPDIVRKSPDVKASPFYVATSNSMGKGYDDTQAEPGYETPDVKRKEMNASSHLTFDAQDSNSDIKRVEVNGDLYALPNKGTVKIDGLSYMDPSHLTPGSQEKNKEQNEPDQPTEYADIVGVMKPKPDKTGEKRKKKK